MFPQTTSDLSGQANVIVQSKRTSRGRRTRQMVPETFNPRVVTAQLDVWSFGMGILMVDCWMSKPAGGQDIVKRLMGL